jgi:hypothetical protein
MAFGSYALRSAARMELRFGIDCIVVRRGYGWNTLRALILDPRAAPHPPDARPMRRL